MQNINAKTLAAIEVPVAPLNEQRRIVAKLEALQARSRRARAALDAVPPLLEKLRQSILAAAFRRDLTKDWRAKHRDVEAASKLLERIRVERRKKWEEAEFAKMKAKGKTPTDDKWKAKYKEPAPVDATGLPELPKGWCWASLEQVTTRITDGTHQPPPTTPSGVPFIGIRNVVGNQVDWESVDNWVSPETHRVLTAACGPERGDLLYMAVGATFGRAVEVAEWEPFVFQRHIALLKLVAAFHPSYAEAALNSPRVFVQAQRAARGAAQPTVTLGELGRFVLPIAPPAEQTIVAERIAHALERVGDMSRASQRTADLLGTLNRATLAKAFRGELVPQDPSDEPAQAMLARLQVANDGTTPTKRRSTTIGSRVAPRG